MLCVVPPYNLSDAFFESINRTSQFSPPSFLSNSSYLARLVVNYVNDTRLQPGHGFDDYDGTLFRKKRDAGSSSSNATEPYGPPNPDSPNPDHPNIPPGLYAVTVYVGFRLDDDNGTYGNIKQALPNLQHGLTTQLPYFNTTDASKEFTPDGNSTLLLLVRHIRFFT